MTSAEPMEIVMPRLSDTMESGTVTRWLKQVGDAVASGEPLLEVETDKATVEVESDEDGFLAQILVADESEAAVGAVVGWLVARAEQLGGPPLPVAGSDGSADDAADEKARVVASPAARRLAQAAEVDLGTLWPGSGPDGRIVRIDVEGVPGRAPEQEEPRTTPDEPLAARAAEPDQGPAVPSRSHRAMALATSRSKAEAPHFYLSLDVRAGSLLGLRRELQGVSGSPVSMTALLTKATAMALERHPQMQRQWRDGALRTLPQVDVGVAVAQPSGELIVPVLRTPGTRSVLDLSAELTDLAARVRATNTLPLGALGGAAITVSNLGGRGIREFYPIIDAGQSAIVGVGAVREELQLLDGSVHACPTLTLSLSVDHRVVAGAAAADFLAETKDVLENPIAMVV